MSGRHLWSTPTLSRGIRNFQGQQTGMTSILDRVPTAGLFSTNNYIPPKETLKFKKDRRVRMATTSNIADETDPYERKPIVKITESAYIDNIRGDNPQTPRRVLKDGLYNKTSDITHSRIYGVNEVEKRTIQDLGVSNNRRKIVTLTGVKAKKDPISIGEPVKQINRDKLWKEERHQRDNGKEVKKILQWDTTKRIRSYTDLSLQNIKQ